ncbi:MAG: FHA domain-containing protein [Vicinamibacterales bacterium]
MWILNSSDEGDEALTFRLSPGAIKTVGRAAGADLVVEAALVSRLHCRLEAGDEMLTVVDLESTNGTYVNGGRVATAHLLPGDRLKVGRVEFQVGRADAG